MQYAMELCGISKVIFNIVLKNRRLYIKFIKSYFYQYTLIFFIIKFEIDCLSSVMFDRGTLLISLFIRGVWQ